MRVRLITAVLTALAAATALTATAPAGALAAAVAVPRTVQPGRLGAVPGAGWFLAVVSEGRRTDYGMLTKSESLELVDPSGARHPILTQSVDRLGIGYFALADWSADGRTALVVVSLRHGAQQAIAVDVATGTQRTLALPVQSSTAMLAPDGSGIFAIGYSGKHGAPTTLISWAGVRTPSTVIGGRVIALSPTTVLSRTPGRKPRSLDVIDLSTRTVARRLPTPGLRCDPVRSWDATRALLACYNRQYVQRLYLVDSSTGVLTRISKPHHARDEAFGDLDARVADSGLYLEVAGSCGVYTARQRADGSLDEAEVPESVGNIVLVGAEGGRLVIQHTMSCEGPASRAVLSRYNPVTGRERAIVRLRGRESFDRVLPFGETQASLY